MIRKSVLSDVEQIMEIIKSVVSEMKLYGNTQWDDSYPQAANFINDINNGDLYVDEENDIIRGFICINFDEPSEYIPLNWQSKEKSLVIHRMAVNPNFRNKGIGMSLLNFSEELALKNGIFYLKIDTYSINDKMNSLFNKFGFKFVGEMDFLGKEKPFYCYDKLIG